jgi:transposase InsO family protein
MKSQLGVAAVDSRVARRAANGVDVAGCIVLSECGSQFRSRKLVAGLGRHQLVRSMGRVGACGERCHGFILRSGAEERVGQSSMVHS